MHISLLAISLSFDIVLFYGKSARQPNTNQIIDDICQQLQQAIETYEMSQVAKIDLEVRKALNFIETGIG